MTGVIAPLSDLWLDRCLAPLQPFLARDDVTDIWINTPGQLWIETLGGTPQCHAIPELTEAHLARLVRQAAAITAQGINRAHPILSASLPTGERIQAVIPPATRGHIAIAIRKHSLTNIRLEDYAARGGFAESRVVRDGDFQARTDRTVDPSRPVEFLRQAVKDRRNILISGGTSSGKTTFLNTLLAEIPDQERLILIEDAPELRVSQPNQVGLLAVRGSLGEAEISTEALLIASLRMRPDRIILGEIRGGEAATFLRAINTGHPGSLSTVHADSPLRAIDQLAFLVLQTGVRMRFEDVVAYVRRSVDIVIQLDRYDGRRRIGELLLL